MTDSCIFCKIVAREAKATILYCDDQVTAFRDTHPVAPTHILIVPKQEIAGVQEITPAEQELLVELFQIVQSLVAELNLEEAGYRLVVNGGKNQDIPLLHFHLISDLK